LIGEEQLIEGYCDFPAVSFDEQTAALDVGPSHANR